MYQFGLISGILYEPRMYLCKTEFWYDAIFIHCESRLLRNSIYQRFRGCGWSSVLGERSRTTSRCRINLIFYFFFFAYLLHLADKQIT